MLHDQQCKAPSMPPSYPQQANSDEVFTQAKVTWPEYPSDPYGLTLNWNVTDGYLPKDPASDDKANAVSALELPDTGAATTKQVIADVMSGRQFGNLKPSPDAAFHAPETPSFPKPRPLYCGNAALRTIPACVTTFGADPVQTSAPGPKRSSFGGWIRCGWNGQ